MISQCVPDAAVVDLTPIVLFAIMLPIGTVSRKKAHILNIGLGTWNLELGCNVCVLVDLLVLVPPLPSLHYTTYIVSICDVNIQYSIRYSMPCK